MVRNKHWADMGEHAKNALEIVEPYYKKNSFGGGWIVYAPLEKKCGGGKRIIMSPIKKVKTEKAAIQHILAISQQKN